MSLALLRRRCTKFCVNESYILLSWSRIKNNDAKFLSTAIPFAARKTVMKTNGLFCSSLSSCFQKLDTSSQYEYQRATFFKKSIEKDVKKYDERKGKLIYVGSLSNMVKFVKAFSVSSSLAGIIVQPYIYMSAGHIDLSLPLTLVVGGFLNFFIFVTPLILHFVTKRYLLNMHYNSIEERYYATSYTFFLREKQHSFKREEVTIPSLAGVFTTFEVNGKPFLADPSGFFDREDYIELMKYDEPVDWTLPSAHEDDSEESKSKEEENERKIKL